MTTRPGVLSLYIVNKSGGLVFHHCFAPETERHLDGGNDLLRLAGAFYGLHAIAKQIAPVPGGGGIQALAAGNVTLQCLQTLTGVKFFFTAVPGTPELAALLRRVYEGYADFVLKNPFHTLDMPIRCAKFDKHVRAAVAAHAQRHLPQQLQQPQYAHA